MITFLGQEMLSTHISSPKNIMYSHFFAKKRYQPTGSVITFLRRNASEKKKKAMKHKMTNLVPSFSTKRVRKSHCHVFLGGLDPGQAPLKTLLLMLRLT